MPVLKDNGDGAERGGRAKDSAHVAWVTDLVQDNQELFRLGVMFIEHVL